MDDQLCLSLHQGEVTLGTIMGFGGLAVVLLLATPSAAYAASPAAEAAHPDARPFDARADADRALDLALRQAGERGTRVLVVMGANWCHDSRALAGWLETPKFREMIRERYELVYIDIGNPQIGQGNNLHIAREFGIEKVKNTPLVLMLDARAKRLNSVKDARSWRNAASRSEAEIADWLQSF